ncbi:MAG: EAL domain-containing protein, partial [Gammaproteobacteria bacterium]|nr:EAL domain-containing protein [Gammaproteobacteria bacterium]
AMGMRIVIDDYGIGACSLAHLSQSPADAIKIDNSFVANLEANQRDQAACSAATAMARELGITVIAEGVETEQQVALLRDAGCEFLQGFYFSKPLNEEDALFYLDSRENANGSSGASV